MIVKTGTPATGADGGGRKIERFGDAFDTVNTAIPNRPQHLKDGFDVLRIDFLTELADELIGRSIGLRVALSVGDIRTSDNLFECIRAIGKSYVATRRELKIDHPDMNQSGGAP
jgi:hypothetical protein